MKHYDIFELRKMTEGFFPVGTTASMSRHIVSCQVCKENLKSINPEFIEEENFSTRENTTVRHYYDDDIQSFQSNRVSLSAGSEMAEHFRSCNDCRRNFFGSNSEFLTETFREILSAETVGYEHFFTPRLNSWLIPLTALSVFLILTLTAVFLVKQNDLETVQAEKIEKVSNIFDKNDRFPVEGNSEDTLKNVTSRTHRNIPAAGVTVKTTKEKPAKSENKAESSEKRQTASRANNPYRISSVRGADDNAAAEQLDAKLENRKESLIFSWQKVPRAAKYKVYLSGSDDNKLVDEFETTDQTIYRIPPELLIQGKKYEIKMLATLDDGRLSSSQTFSFVKGNSSAKKFKP